MAIQVRDKPYHLVSLGTGQRITVSPIKVQLPGTKTNVRERLDQHGNWVRLFSVDDWNGVEIFRSALSIDLRNATRETPYYMDAQGNRWELQHIKGVTAKNDRQK